MCYWVKYKMYSAAEVKGTYVVARNKEAAYEMAAYVRIPYLEGSVPYSAWVESVTYNNGKVKRFNTHEGKPY